MSFKFFKNLHVYCFEQPVTLTAETLQEHLARFPFRSCNQLERFTLGWVPPLEQDGNKTAALVFEANRCLLFTLRRQDKILPPATINDIVKERLVLLEEDLGRKVRKFEKDDLKEQIISELLPQALPRNTETPAYIDLQQNWLVINTPSRKKAEEVINHLRDSLGSLPVVLPQLGQPPVQMMTRWLFSQKLPPTLSFGEDCYLVADASESVTCKNTDLSSSEVHAHLKVGKVVNYLGLQWMDRLAFTLDKDFVIKRLKFSETSPEQEGDVYVDYTIMTGEITQLIIRLFEIFEMSPKETDGDEEIDFDEFDEDAEIDEDEDD